MNFAENLLILFANRITMYIELLYLRIGVLVKRLDLEDCVMKYLSVPQTAERWGISPRRIQILCNEERIPGAVKIGNRWAIPDNEPKPADARIKSGKYIKQRQEM